MYFDKRLVCLLRGDEKMRVKVKRKGMLVFFIVGLVLSIITLPSIVKWGMVGVCILGMIGTLEQD